MGFVFGALSLLPFFIGQTKKGRIPPISNSQTTPTTLLQYVLRYTYPVKRTLLLVLTAVVISAPVLASAMTLEPVIEAGRSFWTFDEARPYSINFVWGPQISLHPEDLSRLYATLPPPYYSGTFALNILIAVTLLLIIGIGITGKTSRKTIVSGCSILFLCTWAFIDLRMGSEFLSWVMTDHQTYITANPEQRTFRDRKQFYDFAEFTKPYLTDRASYVFFARQPWPYLGNMRYLTYPSIPGIDYAHDDTWVIYDRPDVILDAEGRLSTEGIAITEPGMIVGRFDESSFVFRLTK